MSAEDWPTLLGKLNMIEFNLDYVVRSSAQGLNELNSLDNRMQVLSTQMSDLRSEIETFQKGALLRARGDAQMRRSADAQAAYSDVVPPKPMAWSEQLDELRRRAPLNFDLWRDRFEAGRIEYEKRLPSSLSTLDHMDAFQERVAPGAQSGRGC